MTGSNVIAGVSGCGVTGSRVAAHLAAKGLRIAVHDPDRAATASVLRRARRGTAVVLDDPADLATCDLVALCGPAPHATMAAELITNGVSVVSLSDDLDDVRDLLALSPVAVAHDATLIVGAGMAPGLSGLLARWLVDQLHTVDEFHVAMHGTAGPECARQHHKALAAPALGWHDGEWIMPAGGSGRDLVWFPEPVKAWDCYRAALPDPLLLRMAFPSASRITARLSANRRDRFTSRLPMLTPPHAEGGLSAVRVEVRGADADGARETVIAGCSGPAGDIASAVCAAAALQLVREAELRPIGAFSTADERLEPLSLLHHATLLGVRVEEFTGVARATHW